MIWIAAGFGAAFAAGIGFSGAMLFAFRQPRPKIEQLPSQYTIDNSWGRPPWNDHSRS